MIMPNGREDDNGWRAAEFKLVNFDR